MLQGYVLDNVLQAMVDYHQNISDINISIYKPFQVEHDGVLKPVDVTPGPILGHLSPFQTEMIAMVLIKGNEKCLNDLIKTGSCDLSYNLRKKVRFRVNVFWGLGKGEFSIVLRKISAIVPTFEDLKLPAIFKGIVREKNGLILVTGACGSGKSTSLASMLQVINQNQSVHMITLEDPIEFIHQNSKATFNQRELGVDFDSFPTGLRAALRQAPKVILVGEIRDTETLEIALTAAETGHLVLSTLHTVDAGNTINRIIGLFDKDQQEMLRTRLSDTLRWVISQRLIPKIGGGRVAVFEIMGSNLRIKELIMYGEDEAKSFFSVIEASEALGWKTFENSLIMHYRNGSISEEDAISNSTRRNVIRRLIDQVKSQQGEITSDIDNLEIDKDYDRKLEKAS